MEATTAKQGIRVIARASQLLHILASDGNGGMSLGQLAQQAQLPRSTVQRIIDALLAERLVAAGNPQSGYVLGPQIQRLADASQNDVVSELKPSLQRLSRDTGETVDLAVLRDGKMVFVAQEAGRHRLRTVSNVGEIFPLTTTANGKAVLALLAQDEALQLIEGEGAITSARQRKQWLADLARIRKQGFALDLDEHTAGISAIGRAFKSSSGAYYAISIPVPSSRFIDVRKNLEKALTA